MGSSETVEEKRAALLIKHRNLRKERVEKEGETFIYLYRVMVKST